MPAVALSWEVAASGLTLMTALMVAWHGLAPSVVRGGSMAENILIIGDGELACTIADRVNTVLPWGFRLAGYIPVQEERLGMGLRAVAGNGAPSSVVGLRACAEPGNTAHAHILPFRARQTMPSSSLGRLRDIEEVIDHHNIHTVVVALADRRGKLPLASLINAKLHGVSMYDATDFYERLTGRMMVARMHPSSIIFATGFVPGRFTSAMKRLVDVVAAGSLLVLSAPVQLGVALAVALTSRGPVLFRQERVGYGGIAFTMLKFRTMRTDAEKDGPVWAAQDDDRVTSVGHFLRRSRLDELPQLWNILAGQMSFVGPRPERPCFVRDLRAQIPYYAQRHAIRPGLTGWAQVKYPYGASVAETLEKLEYDLYYIKHMSVAFDLTIMAETVRVLLTGKGSR